MKPEPVAGMPGLQTKSNGFNEYSGKAGYSDNPFSFLRSSRGVPQTAYYDSMSNRELYRTNDNNNRAPGIQ